MSATGSRRLRVLTIATTFPAEEGDGTPGFVLSLARALSEDHDVVIVAPRVRGAPRRADMGGVRIRRVAYFPQPLEGLADGAILPNLQAQPWRALEIPSLVLALLATVLRLARLGRPDVIHAHWILPGGLIAAVVGRVLHVPYVLTVHGADAYALQGPVARRLKRWVLARAAVVTAVSHDIADRLGERVPAADVTPMGVDVAAVAAAIGKREPDPTGMLFVGRLVEKKGLDVLLDAAAEVPDVRLTIIGDGPLRAAMEQRAEDLGLGDRVDFLGQQPAEEVMRHLARALALVVPSRVASDGDQEGTPVVLLEAMAAGTPVIASRLGGIAEQVVHAETGVLVSPGSVDDLVRALTGAIEHPELLTIMADGARDRVGEELDLPIIAERYDGFLRRAVGS
jgi:glycosyltransferase involved in cell wall biosynthesis